MEIKQARFLQATHTYQLCPPPDRPEYAFIGRSNVGKSSLINMLTRQPGLAKTSQTPGKTQTINHFLIDETWYLVDLPGYGWAKVSKSEKARFGSMNQDYLLQRTSLICTFVLIDSRLPPQAIDQEFMSWLVEHERPFALIFTKADKQSKARTGILLEAYKAKLLESWEELPEHFVTSTAHATGRDEVLEYIANLNAGFTAAT